ncbi:MAG: SurA N-terminal domain-containing protein [Desulfobaccales bacterium]|nr:SurA N-terminal domain-containing protein [Desulfobaccales bacterium]
MLKWLRKYSKSWFIALAIGAIVVVFIFWGVGGLKSPRFQEVAEVNGTPILLTTYLKQYHELLRQYQEQAQAELTPEIIKTLRLKEQVLSRIIEETLVLQAAERLGIQVSAPELQEQIRSYPFFQEEGKFNEKRYYQLLSRARLTPAEFEEQERQRLLIQKVIREVTSFAKVSIGELQELFRLGHEAVAVRYLMLSPDRFLARLHPSEAEVERYYQDHQEEFRTPARVKVNYLLFRTKDFLERVKVSPAEVEDYLKEHADEFLRPKVIRVRQLLLTVPLKATSDQRRRVDKQAQELLAKVRAGEDFSQLAKAHSQDARSRGEGGDLGYLKRGQSLPEWERVAFALKPGQVGVASTSQGFHLIKVEEVKETEKAPDAAEGATQRLKEDKAKRLAQEAAQEARGELGRASFADVGKKYGITPSETPLFAQKDPIPDLGVQPLFNQAALQLKVGELSRVVDLPLGFAVLKALETQPEEIPPLARVQDQARAALKRQQAKKDAVQEATRLLARLRQGEPLAQVAAQAGLPVKDSDFFTRFPGFLGQPKAESLTGAAFLLSPQNPYPAEPLFWQDKYYLLAFKARRAPDPAEFHQEQDKLVREALEHKRQLLFANWLDTERRRAKIKIFELPS